MFDVEHRVNLFFLSFFLRASDRVALFLRANIDGTLRGWLEDARKGPAARRGRVRCSDARSPSASRCSANAARRAASRRARASTRCSSTSARPHELGSASPRVITSCHSKDADLRGTFTRRGNEVRRPMKSRTYARPRGASLSSRAHPRIYLRGDAQVVENTELLGWDPRRTASGGAEGDLLVPHPPLCTS